MNKKIALPSVSFAILAAFFFGAFNPLGTLAARQMHWTVYAALVTTVAAVASLTTLALRAKPLVLKRNRLWEYAGLGVLSLAIPAGLMGVSFAQAPSLDLGILLRAEVLFSVLFGVFLFGERLSTIQKLGIFFGLGGSVLFSTQGLQNVNGVDVLILLAAAFFSTFLVLVKKLQENHDVVSITAIRATVASLVLWPLAGSHVSGFAGWPEAIALSLAIYFAGTLAYARSVSVLGIWKTSAIAQFLSAAFAIAAGMFFLKETLSFIQWVSTGLLLLGGLLVYNSATKSGRENKQR